MQKLKFVVENLNGLLLSFASTGHIDCINSNMSVLNHTAFLILVKRTLQKGEILKLLQLSFCFVSFLSLVCIFGENNNSNYLKSLHIGHVIIYNTVFSNF